MVYQYLYGIFAYLSSHGCTCIQVKFCVCMPVMHIHMLLNVILLIVSCFKQVDGMDVLAVKQACKFAKEYALKNGPLVSIVICYYMSLKFLFI